MYFIQLYFKRGKFFNIISTNPTFFISSPQIIVRLSSRGSRGDTFFACSFHRTEGFYMMSLKSNYKTIDPPTFMMYKNSWKSIFIQIFAPNCFLHDFVIDYAWISLLLRDVAFTRRPRELSSWSKEWLIFGNLAIWAVHVLEKVLF